MNRMNSIWQWAYGFLAIVWLPWSPLAAQKLGLDKQLQHFAAHFSIDNTARIAVNNLDMYVTNHGVLARDLVNPGSTGGFFFPKGSAKTAIYAAGLNIGAMVNGELCVAVSSYWDEFGPGIMQNGTYTDPNDPRFRVYKITAGDGPGVTDWDNWPVADGAPVDGLGNPLLLGDQTLWAVYNDADPALHTANTGKTAPLGVEVQLTAFAYRWPNALAHTIFLKYRVINKGANTLENAYLGFWSDPDLGSNAVDDFIGYDPNGSLGYCYNSWNPDNFYPASPPAVGYVMLQGPEGDGGGRLNLSAFHSQFSGNELSDAAQVYNAMQGLNLNGTPMIDPTTNQPTTFMFNGDPVANTGWLDMTFLDKRLLLGAGPFTMAPADTQEVIYAILIGQGEDHLNSITRLRAMVPELKNIYDSGFPIPNPPALDAAPVTIDQPPNGSPFRQSLPVAGTVAHLGSGTATFNVEYKISLNGAPEYQSTRTSAALAPGQTQALSFDSWNPTAPGLYDVALITSLSGDGDHANDTLRTRISINAPPAPADFQLVSRTANAATLAWVVPPDPPEIAGYNIYRSAIRGGPYDKLNTVLLTGLNYTDTTIPASPVYYVVTLVPASGPESPYSTELPVYPQTSVASSGLLLVNGIHWATYGEQAVNFYLQQMTGTLAFDFWDLYASNPLGFVPLGEGQAPPPELFFQYKTVIWIGNSYSTDPALGDLEYWQASLPALKQYMLSGGNLLLATRMSDSFFDHVLQTQYAHIAAWSGNVTIGQNNPLVATSPGLVNMPPGNGATASTYAYVFQLSTDPLPNTLAAFTTIFDWDDLGGTIWKAGFRSQLTSGGQFVFIAGRPYRFDPAAAQANCNHILMDWFGHQTVTFQVDMHCEMRLVTPGEIIGVRGGVAPLSWTQTLLMSDLNNDSTFVGDIDFSSLALGTEIQYKFVHHQPPLNDNQSVTWESVVGPPPDPGGNRVFTLAGGAQTLPVAAWNNIADCSQPVKVNVTFWLNTATVPDTVTPRSTVQVRGGFAPLTWNDATGGQMQHVLGDLWKATVQFEVPVGTSIPYKFNVRCDPASGDGWESNVFGGDGANRALVTGAHDITLPVQFFNANNTVSGGNPLFKPYVESDSIDVWFRVNLQGNPDNFDPNTEFIGVRGCEPELNWNTTVLLKQEIGSDNGGQFTYPFGDFYSGRVRLSPAISHVWLDFKFVIANAVGDVRAWEGGPHRVFLQTPRDTTIVWQFWRSQAASPSAWTFKGNSEYQYTGELAGPETVAGGHGIVVDKYNRIWIGNFYRDELHVKYADGSNAPFSPIRSVTVGGQTFPTNNCRGLAVAKDGNILFVQRLTTPSLVSNLIKINLETGEGMARWTEPENLSLTKPAVDGQGFIYVGRVIGLTPVYVIDPNSLATVRRIDLPDFPQFSRGIEVSTDGQHIWSGDLYPENGGLIKRWASADLSNYELAESVLENTQAQLVLQSVRQTVNWGPDSTLWVSQDNATNVNDNSNNALVVLDLKKKEYTYLYMPDLGPGIGNGPRGVAFSVTGDTAYAISWNGNRVFRFVRPAAPWSVSITVNASSGASGFNLFFGGAPQGTDGFDADVDIPAAPPGFNYYAYFSIPVFPQYLATDIRRWAAPFETELSWTLRIINATGITSAVCWNPAALPPQGYFVLKGAGPDINMRTQNCAQVTGDATLTIQYRRRVCVAYDFSVPSGAWYLISLPVVPENNSLQSLFPDALAAFEWNYAGQSYAQATVLEPQKAYWLLVIQPQTVQICGQPLDTYTNNYSVQGWDMCGSVAQPGPVVDNPPNSVLAMFGWDPVTGNYDVIRKPYQVEPTQGYWLLVYGVPSAVTVGSGSSGGSSSVAARMSGDLAAFHAQYGVLPPPPPTYAPTGKPEQKMPTRYGLSQNFPNPFNPETVIEYQLPEAGRVSLKVYSVLGQEVCTLIDGQRPAGYHRVKWDGKDGAGQQIQSGVYLYRFQVGSFVQTKKVVLVK